MRALLRAQNTLLTTHPTRMGDPLTTTHPICITTHPRQPPPVWRRKSPRRARTATSNGRANTPPTTTWGAQKPPTTSETTTMAHASHQAATTALVTRWVMPIARQNAGASEQPLAMAHQWLRPQWQSCATTTTTWGAHCAHHCLSLLGYTWASRRSTRCGFGTRVPHAPAATIAIARGNTLTTRGALCAPHLPLIWATPQGRAEACDTGSPLAHHNQRRTHDQRPTVASAIARHRTMSRGVLCTPHHLSLLGNTPTSRRSARH
jgi:hypothetical protein